MNDALTRTFRAPAPNPAQHKILVPAARTMHRPNGRLIPEILLVIL